MSRFEPSTYRTASKCPNHLPTELLEYRVVANKYYKISYTNKYYIFLRHYKAEKKRILNIDILTFFFFNIELLCLLQKLWQSKKLPWTYRHFGPNYRVVTLSTLYLTVSGFIIPNLKSIGQF